MIDFDQVTVRFGAPTSQRGGLGRRGGAAGGAEGFTAVDNVSLHIDKGDCYGILGQSGAGKSTLVRTVNLLQTPTSGRVVVGGTEVRAGMKAADLRALRLKIGMIFQHFNLIKNASVFDNVAFNLKARGADSAEIARRVPELLASVGLSGRERQFPQALSGGQKQRVAIARALANDPEILLCDEATSALDPDTTLEIVALLKRLKEERNLTVLFITHQMEVAKQLFNKVALMQKGKVVEHGSTYEFFARPSSDYGKQLVRQYQHDLIPDELFLQEEELYEIIYRQEQAFDSVISEAIKRFDADISILGGRVEYINGLPLGRLVISIRSSREPRAAVLDFLSHSAFVTRLEPPAPSPTATEQVAAGAGADDGSGAETRVEQTQQEQEQ